MALEDSDASRSPFSVAVLADEEHPPVAGARAFGPYLLRASVRRLERDGLAVQLGDRAFDILCVLTERAGEIVTNRELMARVWGRVVVGAGSLRFHINALRKVLAQDATQTQYIRNVTRRGYAFMAPVRKATPALPAVSVAQWPELGGMPGKVADIKELARLLGQSRYVTWVGPGTRDEFCSRAPESAAVVAVILGTIAVK